MWLLVSSTAGEKYPLFVDAENVIGRKDCSVILKNDPAISRKHAVITVTHPDNHLSHSHVLPTVKLKDTSKYGTYVNQKKLGEEVVLKNGDCIKFGSDKSKFSLKYEPFIVTSSCLNPALKKSVKNAVRKLGGHVVQEWQKDCSMVVMSNLSVTIKVMCALISCANVVTPEYLTKLLEALQDKEEAPEPTNYLPPLAESQINPNEVSFKADPSRQVLFQGKMFIFLTSKQFKKLNLAIELGGGVPILMEEGSDDNDDSVLIAPGTCVMESSPSENSQQLSQNAQEWITHVFDYLQKHKKRSIPEAELGFAALYSSTEKYCNPNTDGGVNLGAMPGQTFSQQINPFPSQSLAYGADSEQSQEEEPREHSTTTSHFKQPAKIKQELISQAPVVEEPIQQLEMSSNTRKRGREEEEEREPKKKQVKVERRSRSKSPSPRQPESNRDLRSASPERHADDRDDNQNGIGFDFDSVPPRQSQREHLRKHSPVRTNLQEMDGSEFDAVPPRCGKNSRKKSPVPEDIGDFDSLPTRKRGQRTSPKKQSPGPLDEENEFDSVPLRSGVGRTARKKSPAAPDLDDLNEFDSIPQRVGGKKSQVTIDSPQIDAGDLFRNNSSEVVEAADSDDGLSDGFNEVTPQKQMRQARKAHTLSPSPEKRRTRPASRSPSPGKRQTRQSHSRSPSPGSSKNDDFDRIPARKGRKSTKTFEENSDRVDGSVSVKSGKVKQENVSCVSETMETDFDHRANTAIARDRPNSTTVPESEDFDSVPLQKADAKVKHEPAWSPPSPAPESDTRRERDTKPSTSRNVSSRRSNLDIAPELGFLSTVKPTEVPVIKTEENQVDPSLPKACASVSYKSLVVCKQKPTRPGSAMPQAWKGIPVKNFKKFKKIQHQGSNELPRVIGGRDLVPHANLAKKQMMEKFAADLQMTQHEDEDDNQNMFDALSVPERRGRGKRR